jgi:hypothetical protein
MSCSAVDIGGDIYFMGSQQSIKLFAKSRQDFDKAFTKPRAAELICKYFQYGQKEMPDVAAADLTPLIDILQARYNTLKAAAPLNNSVLSMMSVLPYMKNLESILITLKAKLAKPAIRTEIQTTQRQTEQLREDFKSDENKLGTLLEFAYYMLHPEQVPTSIRSKWLEVVEELQRIRPERVVELIRDAVATGDEGTGERIEPFNYFQRLKLSNVATKPSIINSFEEAKKQIVENLQGKEQKRLTDRLKAVATILQIHGYLDTDKIDDLIKSANASATLEGISAELITKIGYSLDPIFSYFEKVYDPTYKFLKQAVGNYVSSGKVIPVSGLMRLVGFSNIINSLAKISLHRYYGIIRLDNLDPSIIEFLRELNTSIDDKLKREVSIDTYKSEFFQQLVSLPVTTKDAIKAAAIDHIGSSPIIGFFLSEQIDLPKNVNAMLQPKTGFLDKVSNEVKGKIAGKMQGPVYSQFLNALQEFFKPNSIFMICGKYENYPRMVPYRIMTMDTSVSPVVPVRIGNEDAIMAFIKENLNETDIRLYDLINSTNLYANAPLLAMLSLLSFKLQLPGTSEEVVKAGTFERVREDAYASIMRYIGNMKIELNTYMAEKKLSTKAMGELKDKIKYMEVMGSIDKVGRDIKRHLGGLDTKEKIDEEITKGEEALQGIVADARKKIDAAVAGPAAGAADVGAKLLKKAQAASAAVAANAAAQAQAQQPQNP